MKKGIDISYWQGDVDFTKVAGNVDFVILREGYRKTTDPKFFEYVQGCKEHGIPIKGIYHFCYATSSEGAREETAVCISNLKKAGLEKDTIVFFDFEYDTVNKAAEQGITLGKAECMLFTETFCEYVEKQGYKAGIYANLDYCKNMYDRELLNKYVFWLADYSGEPDVDCTYHQYSNSGNVPGINTKVDMDYCYEEETKMGRTAEEYLNVWRSWIGFSEANGKHKQIIDLYNSHKPLARGYAVKYTDEWCDTTVSAAAIKAGLVDLIGTECGCEEHVKIFKAKGIWIEDGTITPKPGYIRGYAAPKYDKEELKPPVEDDGRNTIAYPARMKNDTKTYLGAGKEHGQSTLFPVIKKDALVDVMKHIETDKAEKKWYLVRVLHPEKGFLFEYVPAGSFVH